MLSISNPSIVKVSSQIMLRSVQIFSFIFVFVPIGITLVLSRLHERPEILWKCVVYFTAFLRLDSVRVMKSVVSSANVSARASVVA